jgi:hypothetical protein
LRLGICFFIAIRSTTSKDHIPVFDHDKHLSKPINSIQTKESSAGRWQVFTKGGKS